MWILPSPPSGSEVVKAIHDACEANLENSVKDPELRERLRPDYRAACKRLILSEDFYDAIQRPNAKLVTERIALSYHLRRTAHQSLFWK